LNAQQSRMPGMPTMKVLPDNSPILSERTQVMEARLVNGRLELSWDAQMNSEILGEDKTGRRAKWLPIHKENHYRDCVCEHIVTKIRAGLAGRMEATEESAQKAQ
jgi:hypothetical protein